MQSISLAGQPAATALETCLTFLRSGLVRIEELRQRRRTIARLESLEDRMLADIGISRDEIASVVDAQLKRA
jgi:uncharacterized protein YjiS (DUF1127 family)